MKPEQEVLQEVKKMQQERYEQLMKQNPEQDPMRAWQGAGAGLQREYDQMLRARGIKKTDDIG